MTLTWHQGVNDELLRNIKFSLETLEYMEASASTDANFAFIREKKANINTIVYHLKIKPSALRITTNIPGEQNGATAEVSDTEQEPNSVNSHATSSTVETTRTNPGRDAIELSSKTTELDDDATELASEAMEEAMPQAMDIDEDATELDDDATELIDATPQAMDLGDEATELDPQTGLSPAEQYLHIKDYIAQNINSSNIPDTEIGHFQYVINALLVILPPEVDSELHERISSSLVTTYYYLGKHHHFHHAHHLGDENYDLALSHVAHSRFNRNDLLISIAEHSTCDLVGDVNPE